MPKVNWGKLGLWILKTLGMAAAEKVVEKVGEKKS